MPPASEHSRHTRSRGSQADPLGERDPMLDALEALNNGAADGDLGQAAPQLQLAGDNLAEILRKPERPVTLAAPLEPPMRRAAVAAAPASAPEPSGAPHGRQQTVSVSSEVRDRFNAFRKANGQSNNRVVFAALNTRLGKYAELIAARHVPMEPGGLFGSEYVPGRRGVSDDPSLKVQLSFQPTEAERAKIKEEAAKAGAASVSELIDAVLDDYLPLLTPPRRPHRATNHSRPDAT